MTGPAGGVATGWLLALTPTEWASYLGIPTAIIVALVGPVIQRRGERARNDQTRQSGAYAEVWQLYQDAKTTLDQLRATVEQLEAREDRIRVERETERAAWERERVELYRRIVRAGNGRRSGTDDTPPPDTRPAAR